MTKYTKKDIPENDDAALRACAASEAKMQAETILAHLLPEGLIAAEHIKRVQLDALRAVVSVLVPIGDCCHAANKHGDILECRDLVEAVKRIIMLKTTEIEKAMASEYVGDDACRTCGRSGIGLFPAEDGLPMCVECGDIWAEEE